MQWANEPNGGFSRKQGELVRPVIDEGPFGYEAINVASAREKSIRHGHISTLHIWWARRPLTATRPWK